MTGGAINLDVRAFATAAEAMGRRQDSLTLPAGASVTEAWSALVQAYPDLAALEETIAFACNDRVVAHDAVLNDGDTLALLPPVSGG